MECSVKVVLKRFYPRQPDKRVDGQLVHGWDDHWRQTEPFDIRDLKDKLPPIHKPRAGTIATMMIANGANAIKLTDQLYVEKWEEKYIPEEGDEEEEEEGVGAYSARDFPAAGRPYR